MISAFRSCFIILIISLATYASANVIRRPLNANWEFKNVRESKWIAASVPGTVHTDLFMNGIIQNPFLGANEKDLQWIEKENWEYQCSFSMTENDLKLAHIELVFECLDTYATVYLNDKEILCTQNMFMKYSADVKNTIRSGKNMLRIVFESASVKGIEKQSQLTFTLPGDEKVFTRKAQYQYGWDWGPRFVTCGIRKNISLVMWDGFRIKNIQIKQNHLDSSIANLEFIFEIESDQETNVELAIHETFLKKSKSAKQQVVLKQGTALLSVPYKISAPNLWWCNGMGKANLYSFDLVLKNKEGHEDHKTEYAGLRTIELIQNMDEKGKSFFFRLNGAPVFMKGANYIPTDNFLSRTTKEKYDSIVKESVWANMNMLRVWGGGEYADESFYEACDKQGILVWQDFMFACSMYPGDEEFKNNVRDEIQYQVRRLRNHACIALWCGNNEIAEGWENWGWQKQYHYSTEDSVKIISYYKDLFEKTIPETVHANDSRYYWPSSPQHGWGKEESLQEGDSHYWGVWWGGESFETYEKKIGRFASEYGFQGMPSKSIIAAYDHKFKKEILTELCDSTCMEKLFHSEEFLNHQKHPRGYALIREYMLRDFPDPKTFDDYVYLSQILQGRGLVTAIEAHRRARPYCMGSLYWQLNDCWPVTSWSTIDYNMNRKAAHYQVKEAFENVHVSIQNTNDSIFVYVINDSLLPLKGSIDMRIYSNQGDVIGHHGYPVEIQGAEVKLASAQGLNDIGISKKDLDKIILTCTFTSGALSKTKVHYFVKPKDVQFQKAHIVLNAIGSGRYEVSTDKPASNIRLSTYAEDLKFSDNFFDLVPGQNKTISIQHSTHDISTEEIQIKTLADVL